MFHDRRMWCVTDVDSPESLATKLSTQTWCCCTAFRIGCYYWLNDATSPDGAQEYAVLRLVDGRYFVQIESITFSWCDPETTLLFIHRTLAGEFDGTPWRQHVRPYVESPLEHGRCQHCA
jgi:hypothetical protein